MTQIKLCDGQYFSKTVGQEFDKYDEVMQEYMRNPNRGIPKPAAPSAGNRIQSTKVGKDTVWLPGTKGVFTTTDATPYLLHNTVPMMER